MSTKKLKVLHIMSGFGGGISSFIYNKATEMPKYNVQFDIVTYDESADYFVDAIHATGGSIYRMVNPKTQGWPKFIDSFTKPLKENEYDIIHCHIAGVRVIPYYILAKRHSKAKFYMHAHSSIIMDELSQSEKAKVSLDQRINKRVSNLPLGCGEVSIQSIYGESIDKEDMMVIPNSINLDEFAYVDQSLGEDYRQKYGIEDDELVIGHIGRLREVKNHEKSFEIARSLKAKGTKFKLLVIGEGERRTELEAMVEEADLNDVVIFTGRISPISELYPALDVMILPSFSEGLPTVVVEAQVAGIPVVLSDTITEEVDLGLNMLTYADLKGDITEWTQAVENSISVQVPSADVRRETTEEKKFSNEASAKLYVDFLKGKLDHYIIS